ncbi:4-pyridoxolactonase [Pragia fontium]|uniref:MBL fold metallo-hydrolase n=1 Tax=Pragia fontium TaxID=82985 RepID=UPI000DFB53E6|nr:MBL fold metallo-hydrolase [Pragia fontium]SUB83006.1 4-pyridoxolactonase [Pragia fontium]
MATITSFEAGYCTHVACVALKGAGLSVCAFPARTWLIEAGSGRWLWDTGYATHFYDATRHGVFALYRKVTPVYFESSASIANQLRQKGILPQDLNGLILSHFHGDHIAGLRDFTDTRYICSGSGWHDIRPLTGFSALKQGFVPALIPASFESQVSFIEQFEQVDLPAELRPFQRAYVLPDSNKEVMLVELPGHAAGHIGAFVLTAEGWVLLAADAAWSDKNYRELRGPSRLANIIMADSKAYYRTLSDLHQLDKRNVRIYLSHEGNL